MPQVVDSPKPKTDEEWLAKIDNLYGEHDRTKYFYERQWYLNISHFLGFQYSVWNETTQRVEEPRVPSYRVRLVANRILSSVQLAVAKMTKTRPILSTIPATTEEEDRNAARTGDKVLESLWRKYEMDVRLQDILLWALLAGNSYVKAYWNSKTGPKVTYPLDWEGVPITDENSSSIPMVGEDGMTPVQKSFQLGDLAIDLVSPFEIYPDPYAKLGIRPRWLLHAKVMDIESIRQRYPERGEEVAPEKDLTAGSFFEQKLMTLVSTFVSSGMPSETTEESAILKEYWHAPDDRYPNGKLVTVANGIVLQKEDWPEEYLEPDASLDLGPFVKFVDIPIPGRYWAMSGVEQLIPLQKNYNRSRSQVIEARNLMSKPKYWVPRGSNIHQSSITSEPGEVIQYNPVGQHKPEVMSPPQLPPYVVDEQKQTLQDMEEVYGIHQVSKGEAPAGIRAGIAIRFLQEMDDTALGPKIRRMESSLSRLGTLILRIVQKHYKEKRTIQVVGANRSVEVFDFIGSDLRNNTDVAVQAGSGFPELKSAKQQYLLDLYDKGLFGDPADPSIRSKVMRLLEMGDVDTAFEDERIDERWAEQENRLMAQGQQIEPQYFENHVIHKQIHNRYMKSDAFRNLPPDRKELFVRHDFITSNMLAPKPPMPGQMSPDQPGLSPGLEGDTESVGENGSQPASDQGGTSLA